MHQLLKACYIHAVEGRGYRYIESEALDEAFKKIAGWLCEPSRKCGLFITGRCGNGKTTMAWAISSLIFELYADRNLDEQKRVVHVSAADIIEFAKAEDRQKMIMLQSTELLHIDDMGIEPAAIKVWGNEMSPITDVMYKRYDKLLFTIITSNLTEEEICRRYGPRIGDRIVEMFNLIEFDDNSFRNRI